MADIDYSALARETGAIDSVNTLVQPPKGITAPWANLSPKNQETFQIRELDAGRKRIDSINEVLTKGQDVLSQLNRFGEINRRETTGGLVEQFTPEWAILHGSDINEMRKIQQYLGPKQKIEGAGSTSDKDIALYLNALPSPDSKGSTNKNIRAAYQKQYDYSLAKKSFLEEYLSANGHLRGADSAWDKNNKSYMKQMFGPKGSRAEYSRETEGQPAPAAAKFLGWEQ
jgi:hypothetical protein